MKFIYFDASSGLSGDMILGALLDLGVSVDLFKGKMAELGLPVEIRVEDTKRASLRGVKVDVLVQDKKHVHRKWVDIKTIIDKSTFSQAVKENAEAIFKNLFDAESHVHGRKFNEASLHEAGADDAIIDIIGCCFMAEVLNVSEFFASPLNLGQGWVKAAHGILPVPPPAVGELLKGIPVYSAWVKEELVTPTGAAIVSTLAKKFIAFPEITYEKIGYGAGSRDFPEFSNILRAFYGNCEEFKANKKIYLIESNIDDSNPQILANFLNKAFNLGALDVFLTPVIMKKNRLATKLTVLTEIDKIDSLIDAVFRETSSIGVRYFPVERRVLERKTTKVEVLGEEIAIKIACIGGREVNIQPEFSECQMLAEKRQIPVKEIIERVLKEYSGKKEKQ